VVTPALILTFSLGEKGQRLDASLYAVVRRANPVACAWWFRGSMREFVGGNLSPGRNCFRVFENLQGHICEVDAATVSVEWPLGMGVGSRTRRIPVPKIGFVFLSF
jgi:hypothetical protein